MDQDHPRPEMTPGKEEEENGLPIKLLAGLTSASEPNFGSIIGY